MYSVARGYRPSISAQSRTAIRIEARCRALSAVLLAAVTACMLATMFAGRHPSLPTPAAWRASIQDPKARTIVLCVGAS
jgi:hypothetical protein